MLGDREDPGLNLLCRTNKRPTVLALSATTYAQVAVSPEQLWDAAESGFCKQRGGLLYLSLLITLLINNYEFHHSFTYNFANK